MAIYPVAETNKLGECITPVVKPCILYLHKLQDDNICLKILFDIKDDSFSIKKDIRSASKISKYIISVLPNRTSVSC